jgi:hypothetical protein
MSVCPSCRHHSFMPFALQGDLTLVYTAPALSTDLVETPHTILHHKAHLDTMKGPWIWIIDFAKMEAKHYISIHLTQKLATLLNKEHSQTLKAIYLVNPNFWLRNTIKLAKTVLTSDLEKKVTLIDSDGAGMLLQLGSQGIQHKWLLILKEIMKTV